MENPKEESDSERDTLKTEADGPSSETVIKPGGMKTARQWLKEMGHFLNGGNPYYVFVLAEVLAASEISVVPEECPIGDAVDQTRLELIVFAMESYINNCQDEAEQVLERVNSFLKKLIEELSICELIEMGALLSRGGLSFPPEQVMILVGKIFQNLREIDDIHALSKDKSFEAALERKG